MTKIKSDFPFFDNNPNVIYLDNASTTQKPKCMIDSIYDFYNKYNSNIYRGSYSIAENNIKEYENTKEKLASYLNISSDDIAFTLNATESLNASANMVYRRYKKKHGNVVLSTLEHNSSILPWMQLSKENDVELRYIPVNEKYELDVFGLEKLIDENTICVSITFASNVTGSVTNIDYIQKFCKSKNIPIILDLSQIMPHKKINLNDYYFEYACFSAHKMYGPLGVGVIVCGNEESRNGIYKLGGGTIDYIDKKSFIKSNGTKGLEAGTQNISNIIAFGKTIDYLNNLDESAFENEYILSNYFYNEIIKRQYVFTIPQTINKVSIVSFYIKNMSNSDFCELLNNYKICVRNGKHCAHLFFEETKIHSLIRVSFGIYNTKEEVDYLLEKMDYINDKYGGR